jgi:hypothetical protein
MAKPYRGSPFRELERDRAHMNDLRTALESLRKRFAEEGIAFAVIGALAVRRHGHARYTEDIDILTTREGLEKIHERFAGRGINPQAAGLRKRLVDSEHEVNIDVITAGEPAGGAGSPVLYPDPSGEGFFEHEGLRYPTLEKLIEFKLASHLWGNRAQDYADVVRLIQVNRLEATFAEKLVSPLRPKFLEALDLSRREKDIE